MSEHAAINLRDSDRRAEVLESLYSDDTWAKFYAGEQIVDDEVTSCRKLIVDAAADTNVLVDAETLRFVQEDGEPTRLTVTGDPRLFGIFEGILEIPRPVSIAPVEPDGDTRLQQAN